jgi:iron complex outermembrane receptor protein
MNKCRLCRFSWVLLALGASAQAQEASEVDSVAVRSEGDKPGAGLPSDEGAPRAGSTASKAPFGKLRAGVYPFPGLAAAPGANSNSWDAVDLFNHKVQIAPAVSYRRINRDFSSLAASGASAAYTALALNAGQSLPYGIGNKTQAGVVPGLTGSLQVTPEVLVFSSLSKSFKVQGSAESFSLGPGSSLAGGAGSIASLYPLRSRQETAVALDMGALYKSSLFKASASAFLVRFKDRIASSFEPANGAARSFNVGNSTARGLEVEAGTLPVLGFSAYASATYIQSYADDTLPGLNSPFGALGNGSRGAAQVAASGRLFPDTPKSLAALSLQYLNGPLMVNVAGKYTGRRTITVVGDPGLAGFTTFDLNVALQLPADRWFKGPTLRLDVSNAANKRFMLNSLPSLYGGAPRFTSITLESDF